MRRNRIMTLGLAVVLCVSLAGCGGTEETADNSVTMVEAVNPTVGSLSTDTTYIGTVSPQEEIYVIPMVSGTVTAVYCEVGDTVEEGETLFTIDDEAYQLQLASAQASYEYAAAGVTAATGGSRDLSNYQTEMSIRDLAVSLADTEDTLEDLEDAYDEVKETISTLTTQQAAAQATVTSLTEQIGAAKSALAAISDTTSEAYKTAAAELSALQSQLTVAQTQLDTVTASLTSAQSSKSTLKASIESAKDGVETVEESLTQAQEAYSITQNEIYPETDATYDAQLSQAALVIDSAQLYIDYCTVTAPISGTVEAVNVIENNIATSSSAAVTISNKESMTVSFSVTEDAKNTLQIGDHVTVERNGATYDGTITEIATAATSSLFTIKAAVADTGDELPTGVSVKVYATTQESNNSIIIPYDALYFSAGDAYVYCVEDGVLVKTAVTVGLMSDTEAVIEEGLDADSVVVSTWSSRLRDGLEVGVVTLNGESVVVEETEETSEETEDGELTDETADENSEGAEVTEDAEDDAVGTEADETSEDAETTDEDATEEAQ
ncbi:MAG: efflux RND transporter periplasmic adaptor subunit [Lachnospiraceae bacterium]|nr:efflux RND transporter periplasmic adaptor subunit [Lachnospiraceae bacterium]